jgi:hypothetical protein
MRPRATRVASRGKSCPLLVPNQAITIVASSRRHWRCAKMMASPDFTSTYAVHPMASIFQSLLLVIAGSTQRELARQVKYLTVENQILLRKLPGRITITPKERERLLKFGAKLGKTLKRIGTNWSASSW